MSSRQLRAKVMKPMTSTAKGKAISRHPESPLPCRVPHNDPLSGLRRFVLQRLQLPQGECAHKDNRREHEQ